MRLTAAIVVLLPLWFAVAGCDHEDPTRLEPAGDEIVVSGTVTNRTGAAIPGGARVLVVWVVSWTPSDYTYVQGEGELTDGGTRFRVDLSAPPADTALNGGGLGVGLVVLTTEASVGPGDELSEAAVIGVAGQHAVIYVKGNPMLFSLSWVTEFPEGYSVGRGADLPASELDGFERVDPGTVELIVDDPDAIEIVNWS